MTGMTAGQAAYEAWQDRQIRCFPGIMRIEWAEHSGLAQGGWEDIAQAAIKADGSRAALREALAEHAGFLDELFGAVSTDEEPDAGETTEDFALRCVHYLNERITELHGLIAEPAAPGPAGDGELGDAAAQDMGAAEDPLMPAPIPSSATQRRIRDIIREEPSVEQL